MSLSLQVLWSFDDLCISQHIIINHYHHHDGLNLIETIRLQFSFSSSLNSCVIHQFNFVLFINSLWI